MKLDETHQQKLDEYHRTDDKKKKVSLILDICIYLQSKGNIEDIRRVTDEILPFAEELGLQNSLFNIHFFKGETYLIQGDYTTTEVYFKKAMDIAEQAQSPQLLEHIYYYMAILEYQKRDLKESLNYHLKTQQLCEQYDIVDSLPGCYENIAGVYIQLQKYDQAMAYYKKAINLLKPKDMHYHVLGNLGLLYLEIKEYREAQKNILRALYNHKEVGLPKSVVHCLSLLCRLHTETKEYDKAIEYGFELKDYAKKSKLDTYYFIALIRLGHAYNKAGDKTNAQIYFDEALSLQDTVSDKAWVEYLHECILKF